MGARTDRRRDHRPAHAGAPPLPGGGRPLLASLQPPSRGQCNWFEDYGGDLKLGSTQYAYVDGQFQVELPVGERYVEIAKGFEYRPVRQRLTITPAQRELVLPLERPLDWRSQGWVTADTHVHFISPQTAWLEAQAEGVNLVNLLASQWGDLFTFANWARAVRAGRTFTPSGLPIGLSVERRVPGDEIVLPTAGTLHAEAWVQSVQPFDELQVIVNGQIAARQPAAPAGQETRLAAPFRLPGSAWVAARCVSHHKVWHGWPINIGAHTSPVYVRCGNDELFSASDATYMLTLIEGGLTWLDTLSIPASPEHQARSRAVFQSAQASLHGRLAGNGHSHTHAH